MKGCAAKVLCVGLILFSLASLAFALAKRPVVPAKSVRNTARGNGLPTDWSHQHLIFSQPRTAGQAARLQNNTRYLQQQRRTTHAVSNAQPAAGVRPSHFRRHHKRRRGRRMHRDWAEDMGSGAHVAANMFPAKYSLLGTTANCGLATPPDFVIYGTALAGSTTQASILAYTNLYSGCAAPVPATYWAYNTLGTVQTSPVPSLDGSQVAFTQSVAGVASLVLLRFAPFDGSNVRMPLTPTLEAAASYVGCTTPCMAIFPLGVSDDTNSSVFYDYESDTAWVGDNSGGLHKFSPVFNGTPAEVVGGGWPAQLGTAIPTGPVYDNGSDTVFIGDAAGFLYSVGSSGAVTKSAQLGHTLGIEDSPMVDSTAGVVYVAVPDDGAGFAGVYQLPTTFSAGTSGPEVHVGASSATTLTSMYDGDFDLNYLNSRATGNFYVCGDPGGEPTLYQVPILNLTMGTPLAGPVVSTTSGATCSPVTHVYNPNITGQGTPTEWVFLSTQAAGTPTVCGGFSCVMNFRTTSWQPSTVYNLGQEILDSNLNIQVADDSGFTSGSTQPVWSTGVFSETVDGGVHWRNQGPLSAITPPNWAASFSYPGAFQIVDSNNNIEISEIGGGMSGGTQPVWGLNEGDTTNDGSVTWINLGMNPVAALMESGGTSGIIIDNTIDIVGASQVYFSTLQDQACFTSGGTGGCAVQASQQGLQ